MHPEAFEFVRKTAWSLPPLLHVAEFGSRRVNGSVREIFTDAIEYVGIDIVAGNGVDVVADASSWNGTTDYFDAVVCCEVFEHCRNAARVCHNAARVLRPGGVFIVTVAGITRPWHGVDGGPLPAGEFYRGVAPALLRQWMQPFGFTMVDGFSVPTDVYGIGVRIP